MRILVQDLIIGCNNSTITYYKNSKRIVKNNETLFYPTEEILCCNNPVGVYKFSSEDNIDPWVLIIPYNSKEYVQNINEFCFEVFKTKDLNCNYSYTQLNALDYYHKAYS